MAIWNHSPAFQGWVKDVTNQLRRGVGLEVIPKLITATPHGEHSFSHR